MRYQTLRMQLDASKELEEKTRFVSSISMLDSAEIMRVAQDLGTDMRNHWTPDRAFLSRRNREQLIEIAKANGTAEGRSNLATYKKSELVEAILFHDGNARLAAAPTPEQRKALEWLPEAMSFPAVDPDAQEADAPELCEDDEIPESECADDLREAA